MALASKLLAAVLALAAASLTAADLGFGSGLSAAERERAGIDHLPPAKAAALDALVARDTSLARQGGVTAFSRTFTARHGGTEAAAAGIDTLTEPQRAALDAFAARAIATRPDPEASLAWNPPAAPSAPAPLQVSSPPRAEVHGDVSLTVGGGSHGTSFWGAGADVFVTDPSGAWTLGVGVSQFRYKGPAGPYCPLLPDPLWMP